MTCAGRSGPALHGPSNAESSPLANPIPREKLGVISALELSPLLGGGVWAEREADQAMGEPGSKQALKSSKQGETELRGGQLPPPQSLEQG